jgi:hypothetical protein
MKAQAVLQYGLDIIEDETPEQNELAKQITYDEKLLCCNSLQTVCKYFRV